MSACGRNDREASQPGAQVELTFDAVQRGRACKRVEIEGQAPTQCEFRIGRALRIIVAGVGGPGASFTVEKSDADGDYYVTAGGFADHRCAIIKPGRANSALPIDYAFISARTGRVYRSWQACDAAE